MIILVCLEKLDFYIFWKKKKREDIVHDYSQL